MLDAQDGFLRSSVQLEEAQAEAARPVQNRQSAFKSVTRYEAM